MPSPTLAHFQISCALECIPGAVLAADQVGTTYRWEQVVLQRDEKAAVYGVVVGGTTSSTVSLEMTGTTGAENHAR